MFKLVNIISAVAGLIGSLRPNHTISTVLTGVEAAASVATNIVSGGSVQGGIMAILVGIYQAHGEAAVRNFLLPEEKYVLQLTQKLGGDVQIEKQRYEQTVEDLIGLIRGLAEHTDLVDISAHSVPAPNANNVIPIDKPSPINEANPAASGL